MTAPVETVTDPTGGQTPVVSPMDVLRTARSSRKPSGRATTTKRRVPAKRAPTASRAETAAKRGKYADRIVGGIKSGCGLLYTRKPLQAQILIDTAEEWGAALDRVAAEDKRVDAFLSKVSGWFGKSTAWGDLGAVAAKTAAGLLVSAGMTPVGPAGMAVAFLGGAVVEQAVRAVAWQQAEKHVAELGVPVDGDDFIRAVAEVRDQIAAAMLKEIRERPVADDPTPTTAVPDNSSTGFYDPGNP